MDMKFELVAVPVTDVDRAKTFYVDRLGFNLDMDHSAGDTFRFVQFTSPGSACSIAVGIGITDAEPGSLRGLYLVVSDIVTTRVEPVARGADIGAIRHRGEGGWVDGPHPGRQDYNSLAGIADPD